MYRQITLASLQLVAWKTFHSIQFVSGTDTVPLYLSYNISSPKASSTQLVNSTITHNITKVTIESIDPPDTWILIAIFLIVVVLLAILVAFLTSLYRARDHAEFGNQSFLSPSNSYNSSTDEWRRRKSRSCSRNELTCRRHYQRVNQQVSSNLNLVESSDVKKESNLEQMEIISKPGSAHKANSETIHHQILEKQTGANSNENNLTIIDAAKSGQGIA